MQRDTSSSRFLYREILGSDDASTKGEWKPSSVSRAKVRNPHVTPTLASTSKGKNSVICFSLDHLLSPKIHLLYSPKADSHISSSDPLNSRTDQASITSFGSIFQPCAISMANNLFRNVSCMLFHNHFLCLSKCFIPLTSCRAPRRPRISIAD